MAQETPKPKRLTTAQKKKAMIEAMTTTLGNVTASTAACNIHRTTHYSWMEKDDKYAEEILLMEERALDFAEGALMKCIQDGKESSIQFFLKTKGKRRGFIETYHNLNTDVTKNDMKEKTVEELLRIIEGDE